MEANAKFNPFEEISLRLSRIETSIQQLTQVEQPKPEVRFYQVDEAARKLHVSAITIYRNIQSGKIPSKKVGQRVLIPGSFIDK